MRLHFVRYNFACRYFYARHIVFVDILDMLHKGADSITVPDDEYVLACRKFRKDFALVIWHRAVMHGLQGFTVRDRYVPAAAYRGKGFIPYLLFYLPLVLAGIDAVVPFV